MSKAKPLVGIIMGSQSDWPTMKHAADVLTELGVAFETKIVSAHRTPERLYSFAKGAKSFAPGLTEGRGIGPIGSRLEFLFSRRFGFLGEWMDWVE